MRIRALLALFAILCAGTVAYADVSHANAMAAWIASMRAVDTAWADFSTSKTATPETMIQVHQEQTKVLADLLRL